MSPLLLGEYKVWIIIQKVCIRRVTPGPACAPMTAYTFTETWPPGYEEALLRNVSFPGNTVIEVGEQGTGTDQEQDTEERGDLGDEEPDPDTDTDKDVNTDNSNNENIHTVRETVPALLSTMDTIASDDNDDEDEIEITDLQMQTVEAEDVEALEAGPRTPALDNLLCPPPVSSSLVCLQQYHRSRADRRSSRVSLRHQTM